MTAAERVCSGVEPWWARRRRVAKLTYKYSDGERLVVRHLVWYRVSPKVRGSAFQYRHASINTPRPLYRGTVHGLVKPIRILYQRLQRSTTAANPDPALRLTVPQSCQQSLLAQVASTDQSSAAPRMAAKQSCQQSLPAEVALTDQSIAVNNSGLNLSLIHI